MSGAKEEGMGMVAKRAKMVNSERQEEEARVEQVGDVLG